MPKQVQITPEARAVLIRGTWPTPTTFRLPDGQLEPQLYRAVDKVLRALGGRWNRSAQAHTFDADARQQFEAALAEGVAVDQKRTAEQFFTPPAVAKRMFELAHLKRGEHVLEPSAGRGALLSEPILLGCFITIVEQDPVLAEQLAQMLAGHHGCGVWAGDFMKWNPTASAPIDAVLMNPPFSGNQDIHHVMRAFQFLRPGGRLVAIMSPHFTYGGNRFAQEFRGLIGYPENARAIGPGQVALFGKSDQVADASVELLPGGTFKHEGTNVASVLVHIIKAA